MSKKQTLPTPAVEKMEQNLMEYIQNLPKVYDSKEASAAWRRLNEIRESEKQIRHELDSLIRTRETDPPNRTTETYYRDGVILDREKDERWTQLAELQRKYHIIMETRVLAEGEYARAGQEAGAILISDPELRKRFAAVVQKVKQDYNNLIDGLQMWFSARDRIRAKGYNGADSYFLLEPRLAKIGFGDPEYVEGVRKFINDDLQKMLKRLEVPKN